LLARCHASKGNPPIREPALGHDLELAARAEQQDAAEIGVGERDRGIQNGIERPQLLPSRITFPGL